MALRDIRDSRGVPWQVFEIRPSIIPQSILDVRGDFADGWLCFLSETDRKRLAHYPHNWAELSDTELLALLESPKAVVATPTSQRVAVRDDQGVLSQADSSRLA